MRVLAACVTRPCARARERRSSPGLHPRGGLAALGRAAPRTGSSRHLRAKRRSTPSTGACTSRRNAGSPDANTRLVRVIHPFHPLSGRQLVCVGERYNRYGKRLLLRIDNDRVCSVPPHWTDAVAPDPELVVSGGRSPFLVADLLELADLVARLRGQEARKPNNAASVRQISPHQSADCRRK